MSDKVDSVMSKFAQRLKEERKRAGWSQGELAKRAEVTMASISHFEQGSRIPNMPTFYRLCTALGFSMDYISGAVDERHACFGDENWKEFCKHFEYLSRKDIDLIKHQIEYLANRNRPSNWEK